MSNQQTSRRASRKKAPSLAPLYGAMIIVILAIVAVAMSQKDKDARSDAANSKSSGTVNEKSNPFDDVPAGGKVVPSPFGAPGSKSHNPSVSGLLAASVWTEAVSTGEKAKVLLQEANLANKNGDRSTYKKKALEARELFHAALEATAQWDYDIAESHGEEDSQVKQVRSLRNVWFDQRKKLRSVDVNDL